jgi:hypothetical protein
MNFTVKQSFHSVTSAETGKSSMTVQWLVGYFEPAGSEFVSIQAFESKDQAVDFVHYLNGGMRYTDFLRFTHALEHLGEHIIRLTGIIKQR